MAEGKNLGKAYVQIFPSSKGIKGSITNVLSGEADSAGASVGSKITSKIKGAIAVAGIGTALGKALTEGAALEQSIGGIETLFKESSDAMIRNAANAFKTAGLSANEYMETATSFAASLLQGLGGDTEKAAQYADMAITDMSDNANKMGTSIESIQYAYQGFAKQNYTMLDNLKLGYGGTKTEMERLLVDAEKISGIHYDISNLNDVYAAIHVIQGELGITGTTAKEAATTLSGSFASMKSAAQNFLGYLVTGEDIKPALTGLVESTSTFLFNNLVPALGNVISALPDAVNGFIQEGVPTLLNNVISFIQEGLPKFIDSGIDIVLNLVEGITNSLPNLIDSAGELIVKITSTIISKLPQILQAGVKIILKLIEGIVQAVPKLIAKIPEIAKQMITAFKNIDWLQLGKDIISGIIKGIGSMGGALMNAARNAAQNALSAIKQRLGIASPSKVFKNEVGKMIDLGLAEGINGNFKYISDALDNITSLTVPDATLSKEIGSYAGRNALPINLQPAETDKKPSDDVIGAIVSAANAITGAINEKDTSTYIDSSSLSRKLYSSMQAENVRRGSSLVMGR